MSGSVRGVMGNRHSYRDPRHYKGPAPVTHPPVAPGEVPPSHEFKADNELAVPPVLQPIGLYDEEALFTA